jgi:hypothetical protein
MAQTVHEQLVSRNLSISGGKITGTRVFVVWDDAAAITEPSQITLGANGMPAAGDLFPGETTVYALSHTIDPLGDGKATWRVTWQYGPSTNPPSDLGYVERTTSTGFQFLDVYRLNVPSAYGGNGSNGSNIGGTPVDAGGDPTTIRTVVVTLQISENIRDFQMPGRLATIAEAVGKRNSATFEGFAAGTLVYSGNDSSRVNVNLFRLTHRFEYRADFHMQQVPRKNSQGDVSMTFSPQYGFHAETVAFVQPFPQTYDFNTISENF